jgi:hypothetical protein
MKAKFSYKLNNSVIGEFEILVIIDLNKKKIVSIKLKK